MSFNSYPVAASRAMPAAPIKRMKTIFGWN